MKFKIITISLFALLFSFYAHAKSSVFLDPSDPNFESYEDDAADSKGVVKPMVRPDINLMRKAAKSKAVKIVALVNGEMISSEDIDNRINAFVMTTRIPLNSQTEPMIFQRVLHNTIDEKLKLQAAEKNGIKVTEKEVNGSIKQFEASNKTPTGSLKSILDKAGVSEETFRSQIKSDMAWSRLVRKRMAGDMTITQKEIEQAINEAKEDLNTPKYLLNEIYIKKNDAKNINGLVENLRQDPRFELYAMQFSQAPSAASGGKLGWVNKGKLAPEIEKVVSGMKDDSVSNPINVNGDYYIVKLTKSYNPGKDEAPNPNEAEIKKFLEGQKLDSFSGQYLQQLRQQAIIELRN